MRYQEFIEDHFLHYSGLSGPEAERENDDFKFDLYLEFCEEFEFMPEDNKRASDREYDLLTSYLYQNFTENDD